MVKYGIWDASCNRLHDTRLCDDRRQADEACTQASLQVVPVEVRHGRPLLGPVGV